MRTNRGDSRAQRSYVLSAVLALLMSAQAGLGLLFPDEYRDVAWIRATWFGNDWVTLVIAVPLLVPSAVQAGRGSVPGRLAWCGLLAYAVYNYAFYLLGAALNTFFALYVGLVLIATSALALAVRGTDIQRVTASFSATTPVRIVGGYFVLVASALACVWLTMWARYAFFGRPTPVEPEAFRLVAALDLTLMVPALAVGGVLLWRRRRWGYVLAPIAGVQAALYLLVLAVNSGVAIHRGFVPTPGELPVWGTLMVLTAGATGLLLLNSRRFH